MLTYLSGEEIQSGDRVLFHGEAGQVEFVATPGDPETGWYVEQFGNRFMLLVPSFGSVYVSGTDESELEDLEFVSRKRG